MNNTRKIKVGNLYIGGDAPVTVQSMTNTPTADYEATLADSRAGSGGLRYRSLGSQFRR